MTSNISHQLYQEKENQLAKENAKNSFNHTSNVVYDKSKQLKENTQENTIQAKETASQAKETVAHTVDQVKETVAHTVDQAKIIADQKASQVQEVVNEGTNTLMDKVAYVKDSAIYAKDTITDKAVQATTLTGVVIDTFKDKVESYKDYTTDKIEELTEYIKHIDVASHKTDGNFNEVIDKTNERLNKTHDKK